MTAHVYSKWTWGDPVESFPYEQTVSVIEANGRKPPGAFVILSSADTVVLTTCLLLAHGATKEDVEDYVPENPHREDALHVMRRVLDLLEGETEE